MSRSISSDAPVHTLKFLDAGKSLAGGCTDSKVRLWDFTSGSLKQTVSKEQAKHPLTSLLSRLAWTDRANLEAAPKMPNRQTGENFLHILDSSGKEKHRLTAGIGGISIVGFSPDGKTVVAGSYDTDLRFWNVSNGELLRRVEELAVSMFAMSFSPDGKWLATAGVDRIVYLWDTSTWRIARKLTGQPEMISAIDFSPDGKRLVTGGFSELTAAHPVKILLWDLASSKPVKNFDAPRQVTSAVFSPDGQWIAAACRDKSIAVHPAA